MDEQTPAKMGRPPIEINWNAFDSLCQMHATKEEFAYFFQCDEDTINNKCLEKFKKTFSAVFKHKSVGGRMSLRRKLWQTALGDEKENIKAHPATAIFLSKQREERGGLGFADKVTNEIVAGDGTWEDVFAPDTKDAGSK